MALPIEPTKDPMALVGDDVERLLGAMLGTLGDVLGLVRETRAELAEIRATLDRYRPLLEAAEVKMNGPRLFGGRGLQRAQNQG